jgi:L,D-peptidoglycan transpeptidase YkuD (ErfK/YbiS/YcfS/YnhG family)
MRTTRRRAIASFALAAGVLGLRERAFAIARAPLARSDRGIVITVRAKRGAIDGTLKIAGNTYPCVVGKSGIVHPKFEGDGGTPAGHFSMREVRFRADRLGAPKTGLPLFKTAISDGWCDDPEDLAYNRLVHLPHQSDAEEMWRDDHLYDVLGVIGYNDAPTIPGAGSAIFLHVRPPPSDQHQYTAGCVAMALDDLLAVLAVCTPSTTIDIGTT